MGRVMSEVVFSVISVPLEQLLLPTYLHTLFHAAGHTPSQLRRQRQWQTTHPHRPLPSAALPSLTQPHALGHIRRPDHLHREQVTEPGDSITRAGVRH